MKKNILKKYIIPGIIALIFTFICLKMEESYKARDIDVLYNYFRFYIIPILAIAVAIRFYFDKNDKEEKREN